MPIQPFLTRLALGRSPYAPSECTETVVTEHYIQLGPNESEIPQAALDPDRYIQVYDARGNPINPRAEHHSKRMQRAQNEVQLAIGAIERRTTPPSGPITADLMPKSAADEDAVSSWVDFFVHYFVYDPLRSSATSLFHRILAFGVPEHMSLASFVLAQWRFCGLDLLYAGVPATYTLNYMNPIIAEVRLVDRIVDHFPWARRKLRRWGAFRAMLNEAVRYLLTYPIVYHVWIQTLGLLPAIPLFPAWKSLIPFSPWSPLSLPPLSPPSSLSDLADLALGAATSPFILIYFCPVYMSLVMRTLATPPHFGEQMARKLMSTLERSKVLRACRSLCTEGANVGPVTNLNRLAIPSAHQATQDMDGIPPMADDSATSAGRTARRDQVPSPPSSLDHHPQSLLASAPSGSLENIPRLPILRAFGLPMIVLTVRSIASHFIRRHGNSVRHGKCLSHIPDPLSELQSMTFRSAGRILAKVALFSAMEFALKLTLCGVHCGVTAFIGKRNFQWGKSRERAAP